MTYRIDEIFNISYMVTTIKKTGEEVDCYIFPILRV